MISQARGLRYYRPSGSFRPTALLWIAIAAAGALVLSAVYFLLQLIPFIYVNALVAFGFAWGLAYLEGFIVERGHLRSRSMALMSGLVVAGVGLSASYWFGFAWAVLDYVDSHPEVSAAAVLFDQQAFWGWIDARVAGGWKVRSSEINGVGVYVIWGIEALAVLGFVLHRAYQASGLPYCERCKGWTHAATLSLPGLTEAELSPLLKGGDLDAIVDIASPQSEPDDLFRVWLRRFFCPTCDGPSYLSAGTTTFKQGKNGLEASEKTLLQYALLSPEQTTRLKQRLEAATVEPEQPASPAVPAPA